MRIQHPNLWRWGGRLASWQREKRTNKCGMAQMADRVIAVLETDIRYYWPEQAEYIIRIARSDHGSR